MDALSSAGYQVVVVRIDIRFRRPAGAGDTLTIDSAVVDIGASESTWRQVIRRGDTVIVEAEVQAAATNREGRPVRAPEACAGSGGRAGIGQRLAVPQRPCAAPIAETRIPREPSSVGSVDGRWQ
jgi:hypothetical protein